MRLMEAAAHSNLTGIAVVALAALLCGLGLERLRQPAIVGYIIAGVILGPSAFAVVHDRGDIDILAELGVLMLLFVIGMELSLRAFRRVWKLAVLTTLIQIGVSTSVMYLAATVAGFSLGVSIVLGFVVALSSTAVAIKVLEDIGELRTRAGRITVSVLIAQDLAVVPMMLSLGALADGKFDWIILAKVGGSIVFLVVLIWYLSRGKKIRLPFDRMVAGHEDLKPLSALAFCFGAAALSGFIGLSAAYGAFLAGLVIGNSHERARMLESAKPIQSILMMIFFLSIGLLVDLNYIWENLDAVILLFLMVAVFKTVLNVGILRLLGQSWQHAFLAGVMLAQIGEFSFLLSLVGISHGLISEEVGRLVVAVTVLSLALSPLWVVTARRLQAVALAGRESAGEVLNLVYGREAKAVTESLGEARSWTSLYIRRGNYYRRRYQKKIGTSVKLLEGHLKNKLKKAPKNPTEETDKKDA
jgi:monovalent cation:H+ antiporter-2, CPA2 family